MTRKPSLFVFTLGITALSVVAARTPAAPQQPAAQAADLVVTNARIVTVDDARPEAQAIAVAGGRIQALGTSDEIRRYIGARTEVIDAQGQLVVPGLIESHGHFTGIGDAQINLQLMKATSWDEIVAMVAEAVKKAKPGEWIIGRGWHQEKWTARPTPNVEGFPTHASLDAVSPNNPVILTHASGHASFANAKALQLSGITKNTENPPGGDILKDADGNPTGLMRERASGLIKVHAGETPLTPEERVERARRVLELASKEVLSKGITTFEDAGSSFATIDLMKKMVDEDKLGVRLWVMVREGNRAEAPKLKQYRMIDYGDGHLTVRAIKRADRRRAGLAWRVVSRASTRTSLDGSAPRRPPSRRSTSRRRSRWRTGFSSACTRSATAAIARRSTSSSARSRRTPRRRISAGASSTRST